MVCFYFLPDKSSYSGNFISFSSYSIFNLFILSYSIYFIFFLLLFPELTKESYVSDQSYIFTNSLMI